MNTTSLANKYRPTNFDELVGQKFAVKSIKGMLESGNIAATTLLSGPSSSGKTSLARLIARFAVCKEDNAPCEECTSCKLMLRMLHGKGKHPDVAEIDAASSRGIDMIRSLKGESRFKPSRGKFRIFILDEAHQVTAQAFQAALKLFEEPSSKSRFILCTTNPEKIANTILGRCQHFKLRHVTLEDCVELLARVSKAEKFRKRGVKTSLLRKIAEAVQGRPRDALMLLEQVMNYALVSEYKGKLSKLLPKVLEQSASYASHIAVQKYLTGILSGRYELSLLAVQKGLYDDEQVGPFIALTISTLQQILYTWIGPETLPDRNKVGLLHNITFPDGQKNVQKIQDLAKVLDIFLAAQERIKSYLTTPRGILDVSTVQAIAVTSQWKPKKKKVRKGD